MDSQEKSRPVPWYRKIVKSSEGLKCALIVLFILLLPFILKYYKWVLSFDPPENPQENPARTERLQIKKLIREVKKELIAADEARKPEEAPLFRLNKFELELKFVLQNRKSSSLQGGPPELIVVSENSGINSEEVQTIRLTYDIAGEHGIEGPVHSEMPDTKGRPVISAPIPPHKKED